MAVGEVPRRFGWRESRPPAPPPSSDIRPFEYAPARIRARLASIGPNVPVMLKAGDTIGIGSYLITVRESQIQEKAAAPAAAPAAPAAPAAKSSVLPRGRSLVFMLAGIVIIVAAIAVTSLLLPGRARDEILEESATCLIEMAAIAD